MTAKYLAAMLGTFRNLNACPWEASFPIYQALNIVLRYNLAVFICFTSSAWLPISGFSALHWAENPASVRGTLNSCRTVQNVLISLKMTGAQAYYFEEPKSQRVHLVRENISPYDQKWFVGLRSLESRKPYRSTGLPQDVCWSLQSAVWLLSRKLNTEEESIPAGNYISGKYRLFYPSNNLSNLRKLLKYLCHYLHKMISRVQGKT